ncbi:MAG: hypothetical protein M3N59_01945 [bacterium]|nr:hypothetical protein [bacterium]
MRLARKLLLLLLMALAALALAMASVPGSEPKEAPAPAAQPTQLDHDRNGRSLDCHLYLPDRVVERRVRIKPAKNCESFQRHVGRPPGRNREACHFRITMVFIPIREKPPAFSLDAGSPFLKKQCGRAIWSIRKDFVLGLVLTGPPAIELIDMGSRPVLPRPPRDHEDSPDAPDPEASPSGTDTPISS